MGFDGKLAAKFYGSFDSIEEFEKEFVVRGETGFITSPEERKRLKEQESPNDPLDEILFTAGLENTIGFRGAYINPDKYFFNGFERVAIPLFSERVDFKMKQGEYLADLLNVLPHGLIDKKVTGIGATTLEIKSKRNSIIVLPTRILAESKAKKENEEQEKEVCLYVGTKSNNYPTSVKEINEYLDNNIQPKKFIAVADSLKKVIHAIQNKGIDVYRDYFLMVDEIDIMQSDSNYRPQLENIIDYYLKFKVQRRALVSATVGNFSHPELKREQTYAFTTIEFKDIPQRTIDKILHTNNIHISVSDEINKRLCLNPDDKILIAYNSIDGILKIISLLDEKTQEQCKILCSEASEKEVGVYFSKLTDNKLEKQITFMTCAYFTGIDIDDKCHLITVSNIKKAYSILPLNRITQIHGRCRNGVLTDTIIYSSNKARFYYDIDRYRDELKYKAENIIKLLDEANKMIVHDDRKGRKLIKDLFDRIKHLIVERANETLFSNTTFRLTRKNVFDDSVQIAYFNIDALCEKMEAYSNLYSYKKGLYTALHEQGYNLPLLLSDELEITQQQEEKEKQVDSKREKIEEEDLKEARDIIIGLYNTDTLEQRIDNLIRNNKRNVKTFYERVNRHYKYIDINILCDKLLENSQRKAYRNLNNSMSFWILDKKHPFKKQVTSTFKIDKKYTPEEIEENLNHIFFRYFNKRVSKREAVGFINSIFKTTRPQGKYWGIKRTNPYNFPKPKDFVSEHEVAKEGVKLHQLFELVLYESEENKMKRERREKRKEKQHMKLF